MSGRACNGDIRNRGRDRHLYAQRRRIKVDRLVVEHIRAPRSGIAEIPGNFALLDRLNFIIVEHEPRMGSLHNGHVVSMMRTAATEQSADASQDSRYHMDTIPADMYDNSKQFVQPIRVLHIVSCVKKAQLKRESDSVSKFDVFFQLLLILEAL